MHVGRYVFFMLDHRTVGVEYVGADVLPVPSNLPPTCTGYRSQLMHFGRRVRLWIYVPVSKRYTSNVLWMTGVVCVG